MADFVQGNAPNGSGSGWIDPASWRDLGQSQSSLRTDPAYQQDLGQSQFPNETSSLWTDAVYRQPFGQTQYSTYPDGVRPGSIQSQELVSSQLVSIASQEVRMGFIRKVYGILLLMLGVSLLVALPFYLNNIVWDIRHIWLIFVAFVALIGTMCYMACSPQGARSYPNSYALCLIFALAMGVIVGYSVVLITWQTLLLAVFLVFVIVLCLTIYAFNTTVDYSSSRPYAMVFLFMLILFGNIIVLMTVFGADTNVLYLIYSFLGATLFCCFIVYDTQMIMGGTHKLQFAIDDYAMAALQLYLDVINLFTLLLGLMGDRKV